MAIDMTPEQRKVGEANFQKAKEHLGLDRRDFLKAGILGAGAAGGAAAAVYFGYQGVGDPVRAALIGGGDEGGVLVGEHNPDFLQFVAVCDIRPSNMRRIFEGDPKVPLRKGFKKVYGPRAEDKIEKFTDYEEMLRKRKDVEAIVIALPLHLHAPVAIKAMQIGAERGKPIHVLSEKLMAWNIQQCKEMVRWAKKTGSILSVGHQRHYSMVYSHAAEVLKSGVLGDIKHIRALWHRNFSWPYKHDEKLGKLVKGVRQPKLRDGWFPAITEEDYNALQADVQKYGYDDVEQLIRWRLYAETGGGLMAELGSHQLDACSIFLGKVHPLAVSGVSTHCFFGELGKQDGRPNPRNIDDHVFVTYEFPGKNHPRGPARPSGSRGTDPTDVVVVTYSSISTNSLEQYGECLMGTRGSMIVEAERSVMLFTEKDPTVKGDQRTMSINVGTLKKDEAAADSSSTWGGASATVSPGQAVGSGGGPASRGYREEMEDFAYCVRMWDPKLGYAKDESGKYRQRLPRCHGEVAMADAIVALTANRAMHGHQRIVFEDAWFKADDDSVPDDPKAKPKIDVPKG
jgi:predicted dehydrogenase